MEMTIILYHHKYGVDAWLVRRQDAAASAVGAMLDAIDELDAEEARPILRAVAEGRLTDALRAWEEVREDEWFDTRDVPAVPAPDDGSDLTARAAGLLADLAEDEREDEYDARERAGEAAFEARLAAALNRIVRRGAR